ncbi:MAG: hypothetical protein ACE5JJ_04660 [Nitrospinota bacterium]
MSCAATEAPSQAERIAGDVRGMGRVTPKRSERRDAFLLALRRLKQVQKGMRRKDFLQVMKLKPLPTSDWYANFSVTEGWLPELSRTNRLPDGKLVEEYSFGYLEGVRVVERFAVILVDGRVSRVVRFKEEQRVLPPLPEELEAKNLDRATENRLLQDYLARHIWTRKAYESIAPRLAQLKPGMTSAEMRAYLGGQFLRLANGLVYVQPGFLWGEGFRYEKGNGRAIIPMGYREGGQTHLRMIIRTEHGVIAEVKPMGDRVEPSR